MLTALLLLACVPNEQDDKRPRHDRDSASDTASDADTDADADSDTDAGSDTDTDTGVDTGPPGSGGSGGALGDGTGSVGTSVYSFYAPPCMADGHAVAVVYSLHGSGGHGSDMVGVWRSIAQSGCFLVVGLDSESSVSWNFQTDVDNFSTLMDVIDAEYNINRHVLHGYSAGAHWTYVIGLANSEYFDALGVYAGTMYYAEEWGYWPVPGSQPKIPVAIAHGTADTTVPYSEATHAFDTLTAAGWPANLDTYDGGTHGFETASPGVAWTYWTSQW